MATWNVPGVSEGRAWLNKEGHAHTLWTVESDAHAWTDKETGEAGERRDVSAFFEVADCARIVSLDFSVGGYTYPGSATTDDRLLKVDALIIELEDFRSALKSALTWREDV